MCSSCWCCSCCPPTRTSATWRGTLRLLDPPSLSSATLVEVDDTRRGAVPIGLLSRLIESMPAAICVVGEGVRAAAGRTILGESVCRFLAAPVRFKSIRSLGRVCCLRLRSLEPSSAGLVHLATRRSPLPAGAGWAVVPVPDGGGGSVAGLFRFSVELEWQSMARQVLVNSYDTITLYDRLACHSRTKLPPGKRRERPTDWWGKTLLCTWFVHIRQKSMLQWIICAVNYPSSHSSLQQLGCLVTPSIHYTWLSVTPVEVPSIQRYWNLWKWDVHY